MEQPSKQHFQIHLMEDMANDGLNLLSYQRYTDEDFMQHVVRMGWGAAKGHLEPDILERWLLQQAETWAELAAAAGKTVPKGPPEDPQSPPEGLSGAGPRLDLVWSLYYIGAAPKPLRAESGGHPGRPS